jgi:hypothetical protein
MPLPVAKSYDELVLVEITPRTMAWLKNHGRYDDEHPYEAMAVDECPQ